ncbi:glycosyltransferase [Schinkia azotoformans MEV2011]|uniref:Glycosyltransferase n=1 Tax=Schinkia azotoformans MEV2011 TaxID=1348973 RepID=A0A072NNL3_SCHAZ|nr:glycosyltransferase family 4 protein [Schinkia azotoformans]KEF38852.1 glycosyltransferase [Schinkia azotoformans MEV2011]MEC1696756.1 glycosyltransferase family 4 protein [Schinkia azotoformans]MEC1725035.1 glycosyltransferase family 4 protein [Schinkia azotoformans]MEC1772288.1 glycosyltransferase family 4 protein [Schinkia azotoformans]MEC1781349.1 glycosyltransferase family 4 protein [Schinkia azotoformans]
MKKSIWIINQYSITPEYPASTRHYELAKYLAKEFRVRLFGCNFIHHNKKYRFHPYTISKEEKIEDFIFQWIGANSYKGNGKLRSINMLLFSFLLLLVGLCKRDRPDVIIGSSPPLFTAFSSLLISKLRRTHFVLEVRDLWPDSLVQINGVPESKRIVKIMRWMERTLYQQADSIIVLTSGIHSRLIEKGIPKEKVYFLPNGIDMETININLKSHASKRDVLRKEFRYQLDDFVFVYAGSHGPANDLYQIIDAAEQLKEENHLKFLLMGYGPERENLIKAVVDRKLTDKVTLLPSVPKDQINDYLTMADAFIICLKNIPLFKDALPNKLFDYILHDKPIISTVDGEIEKVLTTYKIGMYGSLSERGDHHLVNVLKAVANHQIHCEPGQGLEIIQMHFSREKQARQLAEWLHQLS